jgi:hypothetical protein
MAHSAHIINGLANHSLLSCGQMCDTGYWVIFEEGDAKLLEENVLVHERVVMEGQCDRTTGLWTVPLDNKNQKWSNKFNKWMR